MPSNQPLVTIILPVYNGEKTLKATMDSLLTQTFTNFELLIGIDGTKDRSKSIAVSFKDNRIKVYENETNLGLAENLNILMSYVHPKAKYIAMAEQDDVYVPERLEWQIDIMQKHPEVGLVSGIAEFKSTNNSVLFPGILVKKQQFPQGEDLFTYLYKNQLKVVNTCMMLRKSVHHDNQLIFKNTYGNFNVDWDYILRFSLISEVYGVPKKLVTMNRLVMNTSVTRDKTSQHNASRQLLKDFKIEFPHIITKQLYNKALKQHRKIELGHQNKFDMIFKSIYYFFLYCDLYYLKYILLKAQNYLKK